MNSKPYLNDQVPFAPGGDAPGGCVRRNRGHGRPVQDLLRARIPALMGPLEPGPPIQRPDEDALAAIFRQVNHPDLQPEPVVPPVMTRAPEPVGLPFDAQVTAAQGLPQVERRKELRRLTQEATNYQELRSVLQLVREDRCGPKKQ